MIRRVTQTFLYGLTGTLFCLLLISCTDNSGIKEPLLSPIAPSVSPDTSANFAIIRGTYFLLASECPGDGSSLRVAQDQDSVFLEDGFTFGDDDTVLVGFVDENGRTRFFGDDESRDANCTADVEGSLMRGVCTFVNGPEIDSCRFVYGKEISGSYQIVWNDCQNDGSSLTVEQVGNDVTLINGFNFQTPPSADLYEGVIQDGNILFNVESLDPFGTEQFNCEANVSETILTGRCRDLTVDPPTACTFGYEDTLRTASVDLTDDDLFPSPAITPDVILTPVTNISGTYAMVSNDCQNDGGQIDVSQDDTFLGFLGGFDYHASDPDLYAGTMSSNVDFAFSVLGPTEKAFCDATLTFDTSGVSGFTGTCTVKDGATVVDSCDFAYSKL